MINETELNISNKSYTNKDFASIYPELLELAKKLTNKWDPSTSNESDPGVVLLKLLAFIGDKNNYYIDKSILETFLPSATQESSMRKLTEMNGYEMGYFNSAEVDVTFMYRGLMSNDSDSMSIVLPAYSTVITGTDGETTYVLKDRVELTTRGVSVTKPAIEGTLKFLRGTDNSYIQLNNLDDNNRVYFPERFVAVNGIFVTNVSEENNLWDRVENLNTEVPSVKCFKFGFDSTKNLPYIEFPKNISSLIGNGLDIKYIITKGVDGNVKANFLNKLFNTTDLTTLTTWTSSEAEEALPATLSDLVISNQSASFNGKNPETINEAYNNFKKVVGTFSTLVTTRDYANFIYKLVDSSNNFEVSNIQVSDRRTDVNYSNNIVTFNEFGKTIVSNEDTEKISPFDIILYPLESTKGNYDSSSYYTSFKRKVISTDYLSNNEELDKVRNISHNMLDLKNEDVYLYKNYVKLNVKITTINKVTEAEAVSVITNVKKELYKKFNAREIDYGHEIPYDTIFTTIQQADPRIKNVSLDEPELSTKVMLSSVSEPEVDYNEVNEFGESYHEKLLAKNILAGRISLFDYYDDFSFDFYQSKIDGTGPIIDKLASITTEVVIPSATIGEISGINDGYKLKENEVVQLIGPNLTTKITYPQFINFHYTGDDVEPNVEYQLKPSEVLKINYTDSKKVEKNITYGEGDIIRVSGFTMKATGPDDERAKITKKFNGTDLSMTTLSTDETIEIRDFVKSTLKPTVWKCYWILDERKNPDNCLFPSGQSETILTEGETFIYTDDSMTELVILGSGTKLTISSDSALPPPSFWTLDREKLISKEKINDDGLAAFSAFDWKSIDFSETTLTIQEMSIYTFGEGSTVKITTPFDDDIDNTLIDVDDGAEISYKETDSSDFIVVPQYSITNANWKVNSRLDINMSPTKAQKVQSGQTITFKDKDLTETEIKQDEPNNTVISLNTPIQRSGGVDIDLRVSRFVDQKIEKTHEVSAFVYNQQLADEKFTRDAETDLIVYEVKNYNGVETLPIITFADKTNLILFHWNKSEASSVTSITVSATGATVSVSKYNQEGSNGTLVEGLNILQISGDATKLSITIEGETEDSTDILTIGKLSVINDLNYDRFGFDDDNKEDLTESLLAEISRLATVSETVNEEDIEKDIFYYNAPLDASHLIEVENLSLPHALFDYNNIANQFTLSEIDVNGSTIEVVRASRR